jgi:hypothetical protein
MTLTKNKEIVDLKNEFLINIKFICKNCGSLDYEMVYNIKHFASDFYYDAKSCKSCNRYEEYYNPEHDKICYMFKFPLDIIDFTTKKKDISNWLNN